MEGEKKPTRKEVEEELEAVRGELARLRSELVEARVQVHQTNQLLQGYLERDRQALRQAYAQQGMG